MSERSMLDRHVAFEVARWRGEELEASVREELEALLAWLDGVTVAELAPADEVAPAFAAVVDRLPVTDELVALVAESVAAGHRALLDRDDRAEEIIDRGDVDTVAEVLAGAEALRTEVLDVVTGSEAYSRLVAHVLYHGIKGYVLTENVLARKIPGASSLVRLGQRGLNSAAPGLEAGLDRQLTAFVRANIAETLRDSRRYLETSLDEELLRGMAADAWEQTGDRTVASLAEAVDPGDSEVLVVAAGRMARSVLASGVAGRVVADAAGAMLTRHGERSVGAVLRGCGLTPQALARDVAELVRPAVARADADGFLEARVRARLEPFYATVG